MQTDKVPEGDYLVVDAFPVWNGNVSHKKLRDRMKERKITQRALAIQLNMTERSLCYKLGGRQPFLWREVLAICKILDINNPVGWFE